MFFKVKQIETIERWVYVEAETPEDASRIASDVDDWHESGGGDTQEEVIEINNPSEEMDGEWVHSDGNSYEYGINAEPQPKDPITPIKFLMSVPDEDGGSEVFAFFPTIQHNWKYKSSYAHIGQHGACAEEYANKCKEATPDQYKDLLDELVNQVGYDNLEILNEIQS